jgi:hypothetical protein
MTSTDQTTGPPRVAATAARIDRRTLLRGLAMLGAGGALAACGGGGAAVSEAPSPAASAEGDPASDAVATVAPDASLSLAVVAATFEQLVDQPNPFVFGMFTLEQDPVIDAAAEVWAVPPGDGDPIGPWPAVWADAGGTTDGGATEQAAGAPAALGSLYTVDAAFEATGVHEVVVVTGDGRAGTVAVDVRDAGSSQLPAPGEQAEAVPTPTVDDPLGYEQVCTRTPEPCGMHDVSLDEALADGRPVALLFSTPAFCQTAVCGPTVDVVEQIRRDGYDDVAFIHCEIFSDAGVTVGDPVAAWQLPTEPWLFVIGPQGDIVRRADGPLLVVADEVRSLLDSGLQA